VDGTVEHFGWIVCIKQNLASGISARRDGRVVLAVAALPVTHVVAPPVFGVVNEDDAVLGGDRRRARLNERRVERPAPRPKHHQWAQAFEGRLGLVGAAAVLGGAFAQQGGPCQQVDRGRHVNAVLAPQHPVEAIYFLGY